MKVLKHFTYKRIFFVLLNFFVIFICLYFFSTNFFEKTASDAMVKLTLKKSASPDIINVFVDDESIRKIGAWPWTRTLYADMFEYLNNAGAKLIIFDAVLTGENPKDKENDEEFLNRIKNYDNIIVGVEFTKNENIKNTQEYTNYFDKNFSLNLIDKRSKSHKNNTNYNAIQPMLTNYEKAIHNIGAVNTALSKDGKIRAFEPIITLNDKYYPALPLAAYLKSNKADKIILYDNKYKIHFSDGRITEFQLIQYKDKDIQYIKWLVPYNKTSFVPHEQIEASEVILSYRQLKNGQKPVLNPEKFKNKIIVIGGTANALDDLKITPLTLSMPGSAIQATAIDNMLSEDSIIIPNHYVNIAVMIFFMIIVSLLIYFMPAMYSVISLFIIAFVYFYMLLWAYSEGIALNVITPYLFYILTAIATYSYKFTIEGYKKEKLKRAMTKYVNNSVVNDIIQNEDDITLGGKKTELTVLMADIRGFTKLSENLDPDKVTLLLNEYFEEMLPIIESYKGAVNKFIGDAILAVFNEPIKDKNHPKNAILCAMAMLTKIKELKKKWKSEGKPDIGISIGINTGMAFIGNIGTPSHMEYTVIGDTVNVASRIEAQNRQFNTQILISETTYEYTKDILDVIKISSVEIRGRKKHMDIYEIINILNNDETN